MTQPNIQVDQSPMPAPEVITVMVQGLQGAAGTAGPDNVVVGPTNTLTRKGLWIQTGLGSDGKGITFWVEDGT